jgi:hypothetical protein
MLSRLKKLLSAAGLILCGIIISAAVFLFTDAGDRLMALKESPIQVMGAAEVPKGSIETSLLDDAYAVVVKMFVGDQDDIGLRHGWLDADGFPVVRVRNDSHPIPHFKTRMAVPYDLHALTPSLRHP